MIRSTARLLTFAMFAALLPARGADIVMTPPAAGGVSVTNAAGNTMRFRVGEDGIITLPGITPAPGTTTGLCMEIATGRVGTCTAGTGTVTSVTAGSGLTGGTITSSGTISLAATNLLPAVQCMTNQVPQWSGSAWVCATIPGGGGGTVTSVGATAPLASSGGTAPTISLTPGGNAQVLSSAGGVITWTGSPSLSGNLNFLPATPAAGVITRAGDRFIHGSSDSFFAGARAGPATPAGFHNVGVGADALWSTANSEANVAVGRQAMQFNTIGSFNVAVGRSALRDNVTADANTAIGSSALSRTLWGSNTAVGSFALGNLISGESNIAIGASAGSSVTGSFNIVIGNPGVDAENSTIRVGSAQSRAFVAGIRGITTGLANGRPVLVDANGQLGTRTATDNTFLGMDAGNFTLTGPNNTGVGANALKSVGNGDANVAIGANSLTANVSGHSNVAVGVGALQASSGSSLNTAVGREAGFNLIWGSNTAVGGYALGAATNALGNTAVGADALRFNTTGSRNVAIGAMAGYSVTTGSDNIVIANEGVAAESGAIRIGTSPTQSRAFVAGIRGVTTGSANAITVLIDGNGQLGTANSSRYVKDAIADMGEASEALMKLRPVTFHYKEHGPDSRVQYGLIAEEVEQVYPGLVAKRPDGSAETVMYHFLPPMLLNEVQKQRRIIEDQAREIAALREAVAAIARKQP